MKPTTGTRAVSQAYRRPEIKEVKRWANYMVQLQHFFKRDAYDIPRRFSYLVIWMKSQVAQRSTGMLSIFCFVLLQVKRIAVDEIEDINIDGECIEWCA